ERSASALPPGGRCRGAAPGTAPGARSTGAGGRAGLPRRDPGARGSRRPPRSSPGSRRGRAAQILTSSNEKSFPPGVGQPRPLRAALLPPPQRRGRRSAGEAAPGPSKPAPPAAGGSARPALPGPPRPAAPVPLRGGSPSPQPRGAAAPASPLRTRRAYRLLLPGRQHTCLAACHAEWMRDVIPQPDTFSPGANRSLSRCTRSCRLSGSTFSSSLSLSRVCLFR
uniref:Uncharacterized protein n=1 Tax=Accipiter nisus TaxID=211598 RepID=A0A8B9NM88_9AVES